METMELEIASRAFFETLPDETRNILKEQFKKMDENNDGQVSKQELSAYMAEQGVKMPLSLFNLVDKDGNGFIDWEEAKLLMYLLMSRPVCDNCSCAITAIHYKCTTFFDKKVSYDICPTCYRSRNFSHSHTTFLDNYVLLVKLGTNDQSRESSSQHAGESVLETANEEEEKESLMSVIGSIVLEQSIDIAANTCSIM